MSIINPPALVFFTVAIFVIMFFVLTLAGLLPGQRRSLMADLARRDAALVIVMIAVVAALVVHAAVVGVSAIGWRVAVLATGLAIFLSPFVHGVLSPRLRDGMEGVAVFGVTALFLHWRLAVA